jgi:hypothetical protein
MASPHTIERQRGIKEAGQQLEVLRERWPLAFPFQAQDVRPLALGIAGQIAAAMGWSLPYTLSVLRHWKMAAVYCRAVLAHDQRIALDGAPAGAVDPGAKDLAGRGSRRVTPRRRRPRRPPSRSRRCTLSTATNECAGGGYCPGSTPGHLGTYCTFEELDRCYGRVQISRCKRPATTRRTLDRKTYLTQGG